MKKQLCVLAFLLFPASLWAASLDGARLSSLWGLPFLGLLASIAVLPAAWPKIWHHHLGKIIIGWIGLLLFPMMLVFGWATTWQSAGHTIVSEYIPFLAILVPLFAVGSGVCLHGRIDASPAINTGFLALGAVLASFMGTSGAAILLARPLIRANRYRKHGTHVMVFFIFLVANAGGGLTPIGDPPLFLGFLQGVDFFWTVQHMFLKVLFVCSVLLIIFYALDTYFFKKEGFVEKDHTHHDAVKLYIDGKRNFFFLLMIIGLVVMSGVWKSKISFLIAGATVPLQNVVRDVALFAVAALSLKMTPKRVYTANSFSWEPAREVVILFIGIFLTMIPVTAILSAGRQGALGQLIVWMSDAQGQPINHLYFWVTGLLSAFLDNAPTYLAFFNMAGGDAQVLMTRYAGTLQAISAGAVFMGAMTYIGNSPNFMVKAISESHGIRMPSFLGYLRWSFGILLPVLWLTSIIFFGY